MHVHTHERDSSPRFDGVYIQFYLYFYLNATGFSYNRLTNLSIEDHLCIKHTNTELQYFASLITETIKTNDTSVVTIDEHLP